MTLETWASFAVFTLSWSLIPGPSVGFTIAYAIRHGLSRTVATIAGQLVANAVQILLVSVGLSQLLENSAELFVALKVIGAAYLAYLGARQWRAHALELVEGDPDQISSGMVWRDFRRGFLVCAANPKALLYFAAILPQFVTTAGSRSAQFLLLGATNVLIGGFVLILYALLSGHARDWLASRQKIRIGHRVAGGVMIAAAAYLAVGRRT